MAACCEEALDVWPYVSSSIQEHQQSPAYLKTTKLGRREHSCQKSDNTHQQGFRQQENVSDKSTQQLQ